MERARFFRQQLLVCGILALASCGDAGKPSSPLPPAEPLTAPAGVWTWIDVPDSACDDGTPTGFAVNPGDTSDLFVFFEGGGACWDYITCIALDIVTHGPVGASEWPAREAALTAPFDRTRASNPFHSATMVYIPYCTGDLHVGDNVATYSGATDVHMYHHAGRTDTVLFLARVAATWANPTRVVVSGSSAGGYGATLNYDLIRRVYPGARMYLVDDAGPFLEGDSVPASERMAWYTSWNLDPVVTPICPDCKTDLSAVYAAITARYGKDRMALLSSLQDMVIRSYFMLTPDQFQTALLGLVQDHLAPTANFRAFLIAGEQHTLLGTQDTATTQGVVLESWLDDMVNDHAGWTTVQP